MKTKLGIYNCKPQVTKSDCHIVLCKQAVGDKVHELCKAASLELNDIQVADLISKSVYAKLFKNLCYSDITRRN